MISRKSPIRNQRRSTRKRGQNFLEVSVRPQLANRQRNRFILLWTCKLILFAAFVGGSIYGVREGLRKFLWENPEYNLAVVEINNDGSGITREAILGATGLQVGKNIFSVSLAKAREALAELPQVDHIELRRVLPNKITIDLTERRPVAWLAGAEAADPSASESSFLIDAKGILFKPKRLLSEYLRLPVISGVQTENFLAGEAVQLPEVEAALDLIQQSGDTARFQIQGIDLSKGYCMIVSDIQKKEIVFPLEEIEHNLERLTAVFDYATANQKEIQTVNLMVERNIPFTEVGSLPPPSALTRSMGATPQPPEKEVAGEVGNAKIAPPAPAKAPVKTSVAPRKNLAAKTSTSASRKSTGANRSAPKNAAPEIRRAYPVHPTVSQ